jgi:hypothetical protein
VKRKFHFANLGKALVLLASVLHAGCVVPVAQVLCVLLCLQGMAIDGISAAKVGQHCSAKTAAASAKADCSSPSSTELMLISHVAGDWAQDVGPALAEMPQARFVLLSGTSDIDVPELNLLSPPPKSSALT